MSQSAGSRPRLLGRQIAFAAGLILLLASAAAYVWVQRPLNDAISLERQLARNIGRIMTLDETLTMSARMAAAAHDPAYETRYNANVDELDAVIKATLALVPDDEVATAVSATDGANLRLVEMETQSFELDKKQQHAEALALLEGHAYRSHKTIYANGMRSAFARMESITAASRMAVARWALALQVTLVLALLAVIGIWLIEQRDHRRRAAAHASELEATVAARTAELAQRNRGMRLVLDTVDQAFVTIGLDGTIAPERSAIVDRWFGVPDPATTLPGYLGKLAPEFAEWLKLGLDELREDVMPRELSLAQLPRRFSAGARTFEVAYSPITTGAALGSLLVIISDVTEHLAHERVECEQKDLVSLFQRISIDRAGVEDFLTEAAGLVDALRKETDPVIQRRLVHTLKGNCAIYGLQSYAEFVNTIENELAQDREPLSPEQRDGLVTMWKDAMSRVAPLLGGSRRDVLEIERSELDIAIAQAAATSRELRDTLAAWTRAPMARRFDRMARQIGSLSRRKGRPEPTVCTIGDGLRLEHDGWQSFWAAMVHALRNAVDHGIESPEERQLAGKPEAGLIELGAKRHDGRLIFSLRDDGRGIAWEQVRHEAAKRGMPCATHDDLVQALFVDGLTTRDAITELSGRGVGLSALRQAVDALGGTIAVDSMPGQGTTLRFSFDEGSVIATTAAEATALRSQRTSLLPFPA